MNIEMVWPEQIYWAWGGTFVFIGVCILSGWIGYLLCRTKMRKQGIKHELAIWSANEDGSVSWLWRNSLSYSNRNLKDLNNLLNKRVSELNQQLLDSLIKADDKEGLSVIREQACTLSRHNTIVSIDCDELEDTHILLEYLENQAGK